ncbi:hypothetical protein IIA15_07895 [candidate division TA06 bacterium]|nr:hypothetical protein [candidate division TA06 bacterium]
MGKKAAGFALAVKRGDMKIDKVPMTSRAATRLYLEFDTDTLKSLALGEKTEIKRNSFLGVPAKLRSARAR